MAAEPFRLQNATTLDWTINGTTYPVAGVTEANLSITSDITELETGDSVFRQEHYHSSVRFPVSVTARKFDHDIISDILGTPSSGAFEDRSDLPPFELEGTFDSAERGSSKSITAKVVDIPVPEELPIIQASMDEYVEWTIESDGATLQTFTINTTA